jgi:hypothetical protein
MIPNTRLAKLQLIEEMDAVRQDGIAAGDEESLWAARIMSEEITKLRRELANEMATPYSASPG